MESTKIVVVDSSILTAAFHSHSSPPTDLNGKTVEFAKERISYYLENADKNNIQILLPTPVVAEILTASGANPDLLFESLTGYDSFCVQPFDNRAALLHAKIALKHNPKTPDPEYTKQAIKFDRQIIAIGELHNAEELITADKKMKNYAEALNIRVIGVDSLPLPPHIIQPDLHLVPSADKSSA